MNQNDQNDVFTSYLENNTNGIDIPEINIPEIDKNDTRKKLIIIGILAAIIVALLVGSLVYYFSMRDKLAFSKSMVRLANTLETYQNPLYEEIAPQQLMEKLVYGETYTEAELNIGGIENIPVTIGTDIKMYRNNEAEKLQGKIDLSVMRYDLGNLNVYGDDEILAVTIPKFFDDAFIMDLKNFGASYNQSMIANYLNTRLPEDFSVSLFAEKKEINTDQLTKLYGAIQNNTKDILEITKIEKNVLIAKQDTEIKAICYTVQVKNDALNRIASEEILAEPIDVQIYVDQEKRDVCEIKTITPVHFTKDESTLSIDWKLENNENEDVLHQTCDFSLGNGTETMNILYDGDTSLQDGIYSQVYKLQALYAGMTYALENNYSYEMGTKKFQMDLKASDQTENALIACKGQLGEIIKGESISVQIENADISVDDEPICSMFGKVAVKDCPEEITYEKPEQTIDLFGITEWDLMGLALSFKGDINQLLELGKMFGELGIF